MPITSCSPTSSRSPLSFAALLRHIVHAILGAVNPALRWCRRPSLRRCAALLACGLALAACKEPLYSNLSEQEANDVYATLSRAGIPAEKQAVDEKSWGISIDGSDIAAAMEALNRAGLPRERFASLGELFKRDGIVPTPTEERVRFLYGVSQELAHTLNEVDGVISSRVHIVMPENDPLAEKTKPSSASVFIKHRADVDLQPMLPAIRSLVLRSVEGLTHDTVFVSLFPADVTMGQASPSPTVPLLGSSALGIRVPRAVAGWLDPLLMLVAVALLAALAWFFWKRQQRPATAPAKIRSAPSPSGLPRAAATAATAPPLRRTDR